MTPIIWWTLLAFWILILVLFIQNYNLNEKIENFKAKDNMRDNELWIQFRYNNQLKNWVEKLEIAIVKSLNKIKDLENKQNSKQQKLFDKLYK